jgi:Holliday junction resolvase
MAEPANGFNPFARGRRFEYRTRDQLRKSGWYVVRQARSAFPDLIALKEGNILLVECKMNGRISRSERASINRLRKKIKAVPVLAFRDRGRVSMSRISRSWKFDKPFDPNGFSGVSSI